MNDSIFDLLRWDDWSENLSVYSPNRSTNFSAIPTTIAQTFTGGDTTNDALIGTAEDDVLNGLGGDDILSGEGGADVLDGGEGIDFADYRSSSAAVLVRLWNGTGEGGDAQGDTYDSIEGVYGSDFSDTLIGRSDERDIFYGGDGNDYLYGLGGNDIFYGDAGADVIDGGSGDDFLDYANSSAAVTVNLSTGVGSGGDAEGDMISGIERVFGTAFGDHLTGTDDAYGRDLLYGRDGNDVLSGMDGNDILFGGAGADVLDGGEGDDRADYSSSPTGVEVRLWNGTGVGGDAHGDTLISIERVMGSHHNDLIVGRNGVRDILLGRDGDDTLYGLSGNDILYGGDGADYIDGGDGSDTVSYYHSDVGVDVFLETGLGHNGHAQGDILVGIEGVVGSAHDDELYGRNNADDSFLGGLGDDIMRGYGGDDLFTGSEGADQIYGGDGSDAANYADSDVGVIVKLWEGKGYNGSAEGDILDSIEELAGSYHSDTLMGQSGVGDKIWGRSGNDDLYGLSGDDILIGGTGNDTLTGGSGFDTFIFGIDFGHDTITGFGHDVITDFVIGAGELIDIRAFPEVTDFTDMINNHTSMNGVDTVITIEDNSITLLNTNMGDLIAADFKFAVASSSEPVEEANDAVQADQFAFSDPVPNLAGVEMSKIIEGDASITLLTPYTATPVDIYPFMEEVFDYSLYLDDWDIA